MKPITDMESSNGENKERMRGMLELCPWLQFGGWRSCLYVGAMPTRQDFLAELIAWGWDVDILEAYSPYLDKLRELEGIDQVWPGDVRDYWHEPRDIAFWWHGPEHLPYAETIRALANLERQSRVAVVVGMPFGSTGSGNTDGNDYNLHQSAWSGPDIGALGYQWNITEIGHRNITACKIIGGKP